MNKTIKKVACVFTIVCILIMAGCMWVGTTTDKLEDEYPDGGRDTVDQFGDRRFVVLRGNDKGVVHWVLYDNKSYTIDVIDNYKEIEPYVYAIGEKGYTKLNYETGDYIQETTLDAFSAEDRAIFEELERTKEDIVKR